MDYLDFRVYACAAHADTAVKFRGELNSYSSCGFSQLS